MTIQDREMPSGIHDETISADRLLPTAITTYVYLGIIVVAFSDYRGTWRNYHSCPNCGDRSMRTQALTNVNQALTSEISARQLAQGAVKQAEARLQLVLDATPALLDTGRADGYLDYFNQRWLKYVGVSLEKLQGWAWTTVIHPGRRRRTRGQVARKLGQWRTFRGGSTRAVGGWSVSLDAPSQNAPARRGGEHRQMVWNIERHRRSEESGRSRAAYHQHDSHDGLDRSA